MFCWRLRHGLLLDLHLRSLLVELRVGALLEVVFSSSFFADPLDYLFGNHLFI